MTSATKSRPSSRVTPFRGTVAAKSAKGAQAAVFGAPHGTPYPSIDNRMHQTSADAFRRAMRDDALWLDHWDFDFDGPLYPQAGFKAVDLGNLATTSKDGKGNRAKIEKQTRAIVDAGAVPLMFGGDDSVPIPFIAGFSGIPALTILQIDAHIDWREEREKERHGYSSTMRRASEYPHVWRIVQAGAQGLGSARQKEVEDAQNWGARIVPCRHIHHHGVSSVLDHIEPDTDCLITLDLDSLDASVMPAVAHPSPGGLTYVQLTDLIAGVAAKARIRGFAMVEFVPARDPAGVCAYTAGRIATHVLAHLARAALKSTVA